MATRYEMDCNVLLRRMQIAYEIAQDVTKIAEQAEADWLRAELCLLCMEDPTIKGFHFTMEFEYDDEGGYFKSTTLSIDLEDDCDYDTMNDRGINPSHEALVLLFHSDDHEGRLTRAELMGEK